MKWKALTLIGMFVCLSGFADAENGGEIAASAKKNCKVENNSSKAPISTSTDYGAFAVLAEAGNDNLRGSATYGVYFTPAHRFKFSGEYLTQQLRYDFRHGNKDEWVHQYAIGGVYQALLSKSGFQSVDVEAAYVHAFDRSLGSKKRETEIIHRRIAGSDSAFTSVGTTMSLWECAYLSLALDYDYVKFHRHFQSKRIANGLGGSLNLVQRFAQDFAITLETEFRQPFNYYGAMINWMPQYNSWGLNIGGYFNYTAGKSGVRNIATGGIQLGFSFGGTQKHCNRTIDNSCYTRSFCDAGQWVQTPAVRIPVVLAIADPKTIVQTTAIPCPLPTSDPIPDQFTITLPSTITLNVNPFFHTSGPFTYSMSVVPFLGGNLPDSITLNPNTGILIATLGVANLDVDVNVTITATTACGSTSQTFNLSGPP